MIEPKVEIYTDGGYRDNVGAAGALLIHGNDHMAVWDTIENTTSQRMEIIAVLNGLRELDQPCNVTIYTDSAYVFGAIEEGWLRNWSRNGWRTSKNDIISNIDLWQEMLEVLQPHKVKMVKVKSHSGIPGNEFVDQLCTYSITGQWY
ncbi:MAG: ribonuclease HI [Alphaproteobacteria bacterium]|nr:ribonuclease HI [Alphaproteobacteria bacterium]